jgi:hypothetical protein
VQPEPQAQDLTCVAQPQDWPQVQGLQSHSLFIVISSLVGALTAHTYPRSRTAHLNERAKLTAGRRLECRTCAGKSG